MEVQFKEWKCTVGFAKYNNGRIAIQLIDAHNGYPIATASVNLPHEPMDADEVAIKDYSENAGMYSALNEAGLISTPTRIVQSGYAYIPICKLLEQD